MDWCTPTPCHLPLGALLILCTLCGTGVYLPLPPATPLLPSVAGVHVWFEDVRDASGAPSGHWEWSFGLDGKGAGSE